VYAEIRHHSGKLFQANEVLKRSLNALAHERQLHSVVGQVLVVLTEQIGGYSSSLWLINVEERRGYLHLVCQDGCVVAAKDSDHPNAPYEWPAEDPGWLTLQMKRPFVYYDPAADSQTRSPELRTPFAESGIQMLVLIPLVFAEQLIGVLSVRMATKRQVAEEELEFAQALAQQATLALELTRLAEQAKQTAVLEERNRLAGEIHDALAQSFTGISMQLAVAEEQMAASEGGSLRNVRRANEMAKFGLAEARRSVLNLRSSLIRDSGFITALQRLVERSNMAGRLRCDFRSDRIPDEILSTRIQHELLRIAQEAVSNAVHHAKPTFVAVTLRWNPPNLVLQVTDDGSGISSARLAESDGVGLGSMRDRAGQIGGKLEIQSAAGRGTSVIVTVPTS
jgi:signal transduction histidine kinase